ncbi:hypothetical protein EV182_001451 [Spiromyces aspiralis]|uniref:Uncharacterized protein n=1 Tax=Spiromyces aspiralis TaxID=68401 RepID=A0ACC1HHY2_9FUNG|nr:hypothetical protein EV182_001451 [Spiromyces aspiralis]
MASSQSQSSSQGSAGGHSAGSNRGVLEARVTGSEISIGSSSWPERIKENRLLVDKSFILPRIILDKSPILLTRPRRFGKTMFLSMTEDFFEVPRGETLEEKKARYRDMMVGAIPGFIDEHCGRYPDVRARDEAGFHRNLFDVLDRLLECFPEIDEDVRKKVEKEEADKKAKKEVGKKDGEEIDEKTEADNRIRLLSKLKERLHKKMEFMETDITSCIGILKSLVQFLNAYYRKKCILLIDEFDAPILAASEDNRDTTRRHIREMLSPVVKTTEGLLSRCIMASVNPICLADMYSGDLNNVTILPLHYALQKPYTDNILKLGDMPYLVAFGFTEDEVRKLIATRVFPGPDNEAMVEVALKVARDWYGGYYVFKDFRVYNPWSVMKFIKSLTEAEACSNEAEVLANAQPYWIATGSTEPLRKMYYELNQIELSTSRVILRMCIDYFNIKDSFEPSPSLKTSIQVKLIDSFGGHTIQGDKQRFDEHTNEITVYIAETNWESPTKKPTLNEFMTKAYYNGYLTIIGGMYLTIPNQEMLEFWTRLLTNKAGTSG